MDIKDLSKEEIEMIKKYREEQEKSKLHLKFKNHEETYWDGYHNMRFKIQDGQITLNTESRCEFPKAHKDAGSFYSASGYFRATIPREEILKMKNFFQYYLDITKEKGEL